MTRAFITCKCVVYIFLSVWLLCRVVHREWNIITIWDSVINPRDIVFPNSVILEKMFLRTQDWCAIKDNYDIVTVPTTPSGGRCRGQQVTLGCRSLRPGWLNSIWQMNQTEMWDKSSQCNNHNISIFQHKSEVQQNRFSKYVVREQGWSDITDRVRDHLKAKDCCVFTVDLSSWKK